jgi:trk system potassium uptake protein TrkA/voltage-gated potassium channel
MSEGLSHWATGEQVFASPRRTLIWAVLFVGMVFIVATIGYVSAGWSLGDAIYMVTLTVFSVGYGEVRPIASPVLRALTLATMVLGCTGMIFLTGALVQYFSAIQLRRVLGIDRMKADIQRLNGHVTICGYGRIGVQLAKELHGARRPFVVIDRSEAKIAAAQAMGYLALRADATEEEGLAAAQIASASLLATVLPDDAANVFITLTARAVNPKIEIIARGEAPTTESKLVSAGANHVVLPTHIGAERIAEMILFPATATLLDGSETMRDLKRRLGDIGLALEMVTASPKAALTGETVGEAERRSNGAFFVVQIDRASGQSIAHPAQDVRIEVGDEILLVVRSSRASAGAMFNVDQQKIRQGRSYIS